MLPRYCQLSSEKKRIKTYRASEKERRNNYLASGYSQLSSNTISVAFSTNVEKKKKKPT
jgi:hypothetical protein